MDKVTMGARFKQARLNKHLTQEALGEMCDCGTTYISDIERGKANPTIKTLKRLADAMNMQLKIEFISKK